MITTIVIVLVLFVVWYLNKTSTSTFFHRSETEIRKDFDLIILIWNNLGYSDFDKYKLKEAFEYFILNPSQYNGTSIIADKWLICNLEPESVIHDHDWIFAKSLKELIVTTYQYCERLRKRNTSWLHVWGFIFIGLSIASIYTLINKNN